MLSDKLYDKRNWRKFVKPKPAPTPRRWRRSYKIKLFKHAIACVCLMMGTLWIYYNREPIAVLAGLFYIGVVTQFYVKSLNELNI